MATIGTAYINIAPNMTGIQGKIAGGLRGSGSQFADQFGGEISGKSAVIIGALAGIAQAGITKAMSLVTNSISNAVARVDTLNAAAKTFEYMGFSAKDASTATKDITASILGLPTPLDGAIRGMTSLAATYGDIKLGQKVFSALNDAILGMGGTTAMVDGAIQQLSQLPLDGPLDAQTWNSLRNNGLTPVMVAMGKDMGKSVSQLKSDFGDGTLKVQDFVNELTKMDTQGGGGLVSLHKIALTATSGISTGFANMQTAISRGLASIIQAVGQKNISNAISSIGSAFEKVLKAVASAVPIIVGDIKGFFDFIKNNSAIFGPIAVGIGAIVAALAIWKAGLLAWSTVTRAGIAIQAAFNVVMDANPIGLVALAIVGLVAGLTYLFRNTETGKKIFAELSKIFSDIGTVARMFFDVIRGGDPTLKAGEQRFAGLSKVMSEFGYYIGKVLGFVGGQLKTAFAALGSIFKQAGEALKPLFEAFKQILANKTVQTVLKDIGIALLAIVAAPIVAFFAVLIGSITIMSKVLGFLADHFTVIKVILAVVFSPLLAVIGIVIGSFLLLRATVSVLATVFSTVFNVIKSVVATVFNAIAAAWNTVLAPVFSVIATIVQTILTIFIRVWAAIALVVVGTLSIIAAIIWAAMQGIWNVIMIVWNAIYGVIAAVVGFITGIIVNAWNFYYGIISSVLGAIWGVITGVWNAVSGFIGGVLGTIGGIVAAAWNAVYNTIAGVLGSIWGAVTGAFDNVISFLGGIGAKIIGVFSGAGKWLVDVGKNIIQGLLDGAGSLLSKIGEFFLDKVPGWIKGPFKKALGISSPSTVFYGFGQDTGQGYINAINDAAKPVTRAVSNMANAAISGISGNSPFAPAGATLNVPGAGAVSPAGQIGGAGSKTVIQNNTVNNNVDFTKVVNDMTWELNRVG